MNQRQKEAFEAACVSVNFDVDAATDWVRDNMEPGDVFTKNQLVDWAETNGFVKDTDQ